MRHERSWTIRPEGGDTVFVGLSTGEPAALIDGLLALPHLASSAAILQFPCGGIESYRIFALFQFLKAFVTGCQQ